MFSRTNIQPWLNCEQQGASGRLSSRVSAIESTHAKFDQQLTEVLHTSQQNTLVLNNLASMFTVMMVKMGNTGSVVEPTTSTGQMTNPNMPSVDPMLISGAGNEEETLHKKARTMVSTEGDVHMTNLSPEGVMRGARSVGGDSKVGDSKGHVIVGIDSPIDVSIEGGSVGVGDMTAPPVAQSNPSQVAVDVGGLDVSGKVAGSGSKVVDLEGEGTAKAVVVEGGSSHLENAENRRMPSGNVDVAHPQSPGKRLTPKKSRKKKRHITSPRVGATGSQDVTTVD